jgi:hypothetical protein
MNTFFAKPTSSHEHRHHLQKPAIRAALIFLVNVRKRAAQATLETEKRLFTNLV